MERIDLVMQRLEDTDLYFQVRLKFFVHNSINFINLMESIRISGLL